MALPATGCSDPPLTCEPPIAPGTRYRVTIGPETARSSRCHLVRTERMPVFDITAGEPDPLAGQNACTTTPAAHPPPQEGITLLSCERTQFEMLGSYCQMKYPSMCEGSILFYFDSRPDAPPVDWRAPTIDAVFRIKDSTTAGCIPLSDLANCTDEYLARLDRLQ